MCIVKLLKKGSNSFHVVTCFLLNRVILLDRADNFLDLLDMSFP